MKKNINPGDLKNRDVTKLNYGIIHSQIGFSDGVSIVIKQIESVMTNNLKIPKSNIYYLVGKAKNKSSHIRQKKILWHKHKNDLLLNDHFNKGFGGALSEKIELSILKAREEIKKFIEDKKIDVLIVHNSSHPVNFVSSIAISRYYRNEIARGRKTPKYILWWHDSHLERERYSSPSRDIKNYLLEGVPGKYVDYIVFINRLQFETAHNYLKELDSRSPGLYDKLLHNHTVIYNTVSTFINTFDDFAKEKYSGRIEKFLDEFKIFNLLKKNNLMLKDVQFCLQHTRIVPRKRIDFGLRYAYDVFKKLKEKGKIKSMIFFVSGQSGDEKENYKKELIELNKKLSKQYDTDKFFLIFAEDFKKADISFEEIPLIMSKLGAFSTFFSAVEGFGNNLLEVLSAGLIPAIYAYPVFVSDLANCNFNLVKFDNYTITPELVNEMTEVIENDNLKKEWANKNINILKKNFSNNLIAPKLRTAILKERVIRKRGNEVPNNI